MCLSVHILQIKCSSFEDRQIISKERDNIHKAFKACTAVLLALVMTVSLVNGALAAVVRNDDDTISYEPLE